MLQIGSLVDGKYRILDEVGRGGMSIVYLARNVRTNKQWAIKEVRKDGANDFNVVRANLIAETDILKKLNHPNLPNIIDILDDGDSFVIIMDFIEGNSLQHYIKHSGAQPEADVVKWAIQLCDVLGYLHSRTPPIIYRDMKPANVMLKPDGNISLIDFGTAREYKTASLEDTKNLGTQGYAAPEQYGGQGQTDARTDIYTLGATMYHLLTGDSPANHLFEPLRIRDINPYLSEGLEMVILKCTQSNPDDRYQNCEELMYALNNYNKLTDTYRKQQRNRLVGFFVSLLLTVAFTVGFFALGTAYNNTLQQTYDNKIEEADRAFNNNPDDAIEIYMEAINLLPGRKEAYLAALHSFQIDQDFDASDGEDMENLLKTGAESRRNKERLKEEDPEGYAELCFELGVAYALGRENGSSFTTADVYLKEAEESGYIQNEDDQKRLRVVERICNLATVVRERASSWEEADVSYKEYWDDLYEAHLENDPKLFSNERFKKEFYRFLLARITDSTAWFLDDGVDVNEMYEMINAAREVLADENLNFDGAEQAVRAALNQKG